MLVMKKKENKRRHTVLICLLRISFFFLSLTLTLTPTLYTCTHNSSLPAVVFFFFFPISLFLSLFFFISLSLFLFFYSLFHFLTLSLSSFISPLNFPFSSLPPRHRRPLFTLLLLSSPSFSLSLQLRCFLSSHSLFIFSTFTLLSLFPHPFSRKRYLLSSPHTKKIRQISPHPLVTHTHILITTTQQQQLQQQNIKTQITHNGQQHT